MSSTVRLRFAVSVFFLLSAVMSGSTLVAQDSEDDAQKQLRRVIGNWTLNPLASEAPAPKPPPI